MYAKVSKIGWDNPVQPRRQKCDLAEKRLCQDRGAVADSDAIVSQFWQLWQEMHDQLYRCCLKLMNYNSTDAEDALSQAMLKAREKVVQYTGKIRNLKAWLMQVTRNLCIDLISQRSKEAAGVDSLEWVGETEKVGTMSAIDPPEKVLESEEKVIVIREAIATLPEPLYETFNLHFYRQLSHKEIASEQSISYENVCKRISLSRKHLKQQLSRYFRGTDGEIRGIREQREKIKEIRTEIEVQENPVVETIEAAIPTTVESIVEYKVVANLAIQETGVVGVEGVDFKSVEIKKTEAHENSIEPGKTSSHEARVSGDHRLLSLTPVLLSREIEQLKESQTKQEFAQSSSWERVVLWLMKSPSVLEPLRKIFKWYFYQVMWRICIEKTVRKRE